MFGPLMARVTTPTARSNTVLLGLVGAMENSRGNGTVDVEPPVVQKTHVGDGADLFVQHAMADKSVN